MGEKELSGSELRKLCKSCAKGVLSDKKGKFAGITIAYFVIVGIVNTILSLVPLGSIVSGLLVTLFSVGYMSYCINYFRGTTSEFKNLFDGYNKTPEKSIVIYLLILLITLVALGIPSILIFLAIMLIEDTFTNVFICIVLAIVLFVLILLVNTYYFSTYYLVLDGYEGGAVDLLKASRELIEGRVLDYILFVLSFMGWFLTVPITLGLSLLLIYPYMTLANARYYMYLRESNLEKVVESSVK